LLRLLLPLNDMVYQSSRNTIKVAPN